MHLPYQRGSGSVRPKFCDPREKAAVVLGSEQYEGGGGGS